MPFPTNPEDFGQRFVAQPTYRYVTVAEFDDLTSNPTPLADILGPDTEILYIEAADLRRPDNPPKRTYLTGDLSPVGKWARWLQSWRDHDREFDGTHPESHDGEYSWIAIKQVKMGKRGTHDVWLYDGVPSPEEIASLPAAGQPSATAPPPQAPAETVEQAKVDHDTLCEAILLVSADGITPVALFGAVNEMTMAKVPQQDVINAREALVAKGALKSEDGKLYATR